MRLCAGAKSERKTAAGNVTLPLYIDDYSAANGQGLGWSCVPGTQSASIQRKALFFGDLWPGPKYRRSSRFTLANRRSNVRVSVAMFLECLSAQFWVPRLQLSHCLQ